jgi:hypothetical protein
MDRLECCRPARYRRPSLHGIGAGNSLLAEQRANRAAKRYVYAARRSSLPLGLGYPVLASALAAADLTTVIAGTATQVDVLTSKTFSSGSGLGLTGTTAGCDTD